MTPEVLRAAILADADRVIVSWIASHAIGKEGMRRLKAQRRFWEIATAGEMQTLLDLLNREP